MSDRVLITIHLPMDMGKASKIMEVVGQMFPGACVKNDDAGNMQIFEETK